MCIIPTSCGVSFRVRLFLGRRCDNDDNRAVLSRFFPAPAEEALLSEVARTEAKCSKIIVLIFISIVFNLDFYLSISLTQLLSDYNRIFLSAFLSFPKPSTRKLVEKEPEKYLLMAG